MMPKALNLLLVFGLALCASLVQADTRPPFLESYKATALALKANPTDLKRETAEERTARVSEAAEVFYAAADKATCGGGSQPGCKRLWPGKRRDLALALLGIAYHESGLAHYVGSGHCEDGPKGARCDNGKARTYLQVHQDTCPTVWLFEEGSRAELEAAADCAVLIFKKAAQLCSDSDRKGQITRRASWSELFAKYGGRTCAWTGGVERELTKIRVEQLLARH